MFPLLNTGLNLLPGCCPVKHIQICKCDLQQNDIADRPVCSAHTMPVYWRRLQLVTTHTAQTWVDRFGWHYQQNIAENNGELAFLS